MFKNSDLYSSGCFYAAGVALSIMGAILALLVAAYWLMVYAGQFEVLVLTHTGEVTFLALPWLAVLLYVLGALIRWPAGERIVVPQTLIKVLVWPGKYCGIIHTPSAMGWHSVGSPGLVGLWMRQHGLDWCLVAHQNNDCTFTVTVADYSHLGELLDSRRYWAYIPMSSAVMDSEAQRLVLEYQLNAQLEQRQTNQE